MKTSALALTCLLGPAALRPLPGSPARVFRSLCTSSLWAHPQEANKHWPYGTVHNKSAEL